MSIKTLIDAGLQYLTNRRDNMAKKTDTSKVKGRCRACGGEIVEVNGNTRRKACIKCGKEAL